MPHWCSAPSWQLGALPVTQRPLCRSTQLRSLLRVIGDTIQLVIRPPNTGITTYSVPSWLSQRSLHRLAPFLLLDTFKATRRPLDLPGPREYYCWAIGGMLLNKCLEAIKVFVYWAFRVQRVLWSFCDHSLVLNNH